MSRIHLSCTATTICQKTTPIFVGLQCTVIPLSSTITIRTGPAQVERTVNIDIDIVGDDQLIKLEICNSGIRFLNGKSQMWVLAAFI